jgi:5'-nucleotidase, C-terminal domain
MAVLQHRSLVLPPEFADVTLNDLGMGQLFSALFAEGDLVLCKQITGSDLNSLLKQSKQYQDDEDNGLLAESMKGSSLAVLGASNTAADETKREINGQLIDPKRLYSIAIPDMLLGGQTGYSVFAADAPPATPLSKTIVRSLAQLVAKRFLDGTKGAETVARSGTDAVDGSQLKSAVAGGCTFMRPEEVKQRGFRDWLKDGLPLPHKKAFACGAIQGGQGFKGRTDEGCGEEFVQQRPLWWVMLYKADVSYSQFLHGYSETTVGQQFLAARV